MKSRYWWVPLGKTRATYSAPTMASANAAGVRLRVDRNSCPPGLSRRAQASMTEAGSGTCSSISMQVMASNEAGASAASASTGISR